LKKRPHKNGHKIAEVLNIRDGIIPDFPVFFNHKFPNIDEKNEY